MELKAEHIYKEFGVTPVLENVSLSLSRGVKAGLVGSNGVGKSTLLKILAGELEPDNGTVTRRKNLVLGYMPQDTSMAGDKVVRDYIRRISGFARLEEEMGTSAEALTEYELRLPFCPPEWKSFLLCRASCGNQNSQSGFSSKKVRILTKRHRQLVQYPALWAR